MRGRISIVLVALLTLAGCGGGGGTAQDIARTPPKQTGVPKNGGTAVVALTPGLSPNYIYPYPPASSSGTVIARGQLWRSLYRPSGEGDQIVDTASSLADPPVYSKDRKTVTIKMREYKWSTGRPVTAADVVFSLDLLKAGLAESPANWSFYTPGQFPDGVSAEATAADTLTLTLDTAYNPSYLLSVLSLLYIMPSAEWNIARTDGPHLDFTRPGNAKAIYRYLTKESADQKSFAGNPLWQVVNGPYRLKSFDPTTGSYSLAANKAYSGPGEKRLDQIDFKAFTSASAVLNQMKAGNLTVGTLDSGFISQAAALKAKGYNVYGAPAPARFDSLTINFKNTVNNFDQVIAQPYVRQALQRLIDQKGYIASRGIYGGAGSENYTTGGADSPYPASFGSTAPYPHDEDAARKLLTDHGWKVVPGGSTTCEKPALCGSGIKQGQTIRFTLASADTPKYVGARDIAFASAAKKLGIRVDLVTKSLNYMYANYGNSFAPAKSNEWAMQDEGGLYQAAGYPTSNTVFNTGGSFNLGSYTDPEADRLINASTFGADSTALSAEVTAVSKDLPVLFLPTPDTLVVWKKTLSGPGSSFQALLSSLYTPEQWFFHN
ncbi:ABC transporter substrate-binding protein [Streptomyces sp. NBC_01260]|uniref:ABC transporter substrate-binding protein n=1 Tax=unclassified Streptomyces TaxID=2593676 RepID=UPI000F551FCA|nr:MULTISPECIES: ABC transporter substrate-binding protein [unclassified Streptomyces]MCX4770323.1 ABC transporter substrate-binding protein [Streptomyces sp. NBC_01285]RPK44813.1 Bacterial extracellular solute-binding protein [Streptomyces sp. ADI92-24]